MDEPNVVNPRNRMSCSLEQEGNPDVRCSLGQPRGGRYAKPVTNTRFHPEEVPRVVKFRDTEVELGFPGAERRRLGRCSLMGTEFQFGEMKRVLWMGGGDRCTTM